MLTAGEVLDFGPLQMKMVVRQASAELLEAEMEIGPHAAGTPLHTHPHARETYAVLEGKFEVYLHGAWRTWTPGQQIVVEPGSAHTFRNSSDAPTRVLNTHQPALKMAEYFEGLHKLAASGVTKGRLNLAALLSLSLLMTSFKDEIHPVNPPAPVMQLFGFFGKLAGYRI